MDALASLSGKVFLVAFMANLGLRLAPGAVAAEFSHPWRLARGLLLMLVLVPLTTLLWVQALGVTRWVAVALVLLAVCPGPPVLRPGSRQGRGKRRVCADVDACCSAS